MTYQLANGDALAIIFEDGTHRVYDVWELEHYGDDVAPMYEGFYENCIEFCRNIDVCIMGETF